MTPFATVNHTGDAVPDAVPRAILSPVVHDEPPPGAPGASPDSWADATEPPVATARATRAPKATRRAGMRPATDGTAGLQCMGRKVTSHASQVSASHAGNAPTRLRAAPPSRRPHDASTYSTKSSNPRRLIHLGCDFPPAAGLAFTSDAPAHPPPASSGAATRRTSYAVGG